MFEKYIDNKEHMFYAYHYLLQAICLYLNSTATLLLDMSIYINTEHIVSLCFKSKNIGNRENFL